MVNNDKLSAFNILKRGIEAEVKERIANDIIEDYVSLLRARLKNKLKPILQAVTFEYIENFADLMMMRDEICVRIKVNEDIFEASTKSLRQREAE